MVLKILNSTEPYSEQRVTVSGTTLTLILKFNVRNDSWYIDIKDGSGETNILSGIKVMPNQNLTGRYILSNFPEGNFWCFRTKADDSSLGRDNLGSGKSYELYWLSNTEEQELNINDNIQL